MYANPLEPVVCPQLALARYIIAHPSIITVQINLFKGHYQCECFKKIFNDFSRNNWYEFESLGISVEDFRTHSIRKWEDTFVAKVCTVSLPMASICLRANWTLRGVKDRYIKYKKSGDEFVGRAVTALPILKKYFAMSPPYFDITSYQNDCEKEIRSQS